MRGSYCESVEAVLVLQLQDMCGGGGDEPNAEPKGRKTSQPRIHVDSLANVSHILSPTFVYCSHGTTCQGKLRVDKIFLVFKVDKYEATST
jgi:hypothetical protein